MSSSHMIETEQRCSGRFQGDLDYLEYLQSTKADLQNKIAEGNDDLLTKEVLDEYAEHVTTGLEHLAAPNFVLNWQEHRAMKEFVSLALRHDFKEQDLQDIVLELLSSSNIENDEFIHAFSQFLSLRLAAKLHHENLAAGGSGISQDFDALAEFVENAVLDGALSLRVMTAREFAGQRTPFAFNNVFYEIRVAPLNDNFPVTVKLGLLIHESYHAFQFMNSQDPLSLTRLQDEEPATSIGLRAELLAEGAEYSSESLNLFLLALDESEFYQSLSDKVLDCLGYDDWQTRLRNEYTAKYISLQSDLMEAQRSQLLGNQPDFSAHDLFYDFFKALYLLRWRDVFATTTQQIIAKSFISGDYERLTETFITKAADISELRKRMVSEPEKTPQRANEAFVYMRGLIWLATLSFYLDQQEVYEAVTKRFYDDADIIADSLIYGNL